MLTLTISEFQGCDSVSYHSAVDWSHGVTEIYFAYIEREDMSEVYEEPKQQTPSFLGGDLPCVHG